MSGFNFNKQKVQIMENLNQVAWFVNRKKFNFQPFMAETEPFQLIPLTEMLIADVKEEKTLESLLFLAADSGISVRRDRIIDDDDMAEEIDYFWTLPQNNVDCDTSIRLQVGLEVCEISGLSEYVETVRQVEKEKKEAEDLAAKAKSLDELKTQGYLDGDKSTPLVSLGQLDEDEAA